METFSKMIPNRFSGDKWIFTLSNIPIETTMSNMVYFDNYVRNVTIPDYNLEIINIEGPYGFQLKHPLSPKKNQNLSQLQVTYRLSEDFMNYLIMFKWLQELKYGQPTNHNDDLPFRKYAVNQGIIQLLDNQKRVIAHLKFTNMLPVSLSSLSLDMGTSEEKDFTINFSYEEIFYETFGIFDGAMNPTAPELVDPCGTIEPINTGGTWLQN